MSNLKYDLREGGGGGQPGGGGGGQNPGGGSNQGKSPMILSGIAKVAVAARAINLVPVSRAAVVSPIANCNQ